MSLLTAPACRIDVQETDEEGASGLPDQTIQSIQQKHKHTP